MSLDPNGETEFGRQALDFAASLTATTQGVLGPDTEPFVARAVSYEATARVVIRQESQRGLSLRVDGTPLLLLKASFNCTWDHREAYLAVEESAFAVLLMGEQEPLFRVEYLRTTTGSVPVSHLQIHAHRDSITFAMLRCGDKSTRGKRRGKLADRGKHEARLSALHFPLGGHRFRPSLEDILEMLLDEFGVDSVGSAREWIQQGRMDWRRKQLGAAVRDSAQSAAGVLQELGYTVTTPAAGHYPDREARLRAY